MSFIKATVVGDGVSYETYHRQEAKRGDKDYSMSRSELVSFKLCPKRWIDGFGADADSTTSTEWGSMIDCLLTSPDKFDSLFAVAPDTYPDRKTGKPKPFTISANWCEEWKAEQFGKTIIKSKLRRNADLAVAAINEIPEVAELFKVSRKQVFVIGFWLDKLTGLEIPVRVLMDIVPPADHAEFGKTVFDFKTARNGDPANWARVCDDNSYDVQNALYRDLWVAATGEDRTDAGNIVQENVFPYHVTTPIPIMSSEFLQWGRIKYENAFRLYAQCLATGVWGSYAPAGMVYRLFQIISPDSLWSYRQFAGVLDVRTNAPEPLPKQEERFDLVP